MKKFILATMILAPALGVVAADDFQYTDDFRTIESYNVTSPEAYELIRSENFTPYRYDVRRANELVKKNIVTGIEVPGVDIHTCLNWKSCVQRSYRSTRGYNGIYKKTGDEAKMAGFSWTRKDGQEYKNQLDGERSGLNKLERLYR